MKHDMNTIENIKARISELARRHQETNDDLDGMKESELLEAMAEDLIIEYCGANGYTVNGFPTNKKSIRQIEDEGDNFSRERYRFYLDSLSCSNEDVAELTWHYTSSFWPDSYQTKTEYLESTKENLESGVLYDFEL